MDLAKQILTERFYQEFIAFSILSVLAVLVACLIIFLYITRYKRMKKGLRAFLFGAILAFLLLVAAVGVLETRYIRDLQYVQNGDFCYVEGELIGYAKSSTSGDEVTVTRSWPIIKDDANGQTVSLNILHSEERTNVGERYAVIYLPNTKVAEIVQE